MNYEITAEVFNQVAENSNKTGSILTDPKLIKKLFNKVGYNINAGKDTTFTGAELKAKIKADLKLEDAVIDITLKTGSGKDIADDVACEVYGIRFRAIKPYTAPAEPVVPVNPTN
jgi:hypothetical protein